MTSNFSGNLVHIVIHDNATLKEIQEAIMFLKNIESLEIADLERYLDRIKDSERRKREQDDSGNEIPVSDDNT